MSNQYDDILEKIHYNEVKNQENDIPNEMKDKFPEIKLNITNQPTTE